MVMHLLVGDDIVYYKENTSLLSDQNNFCATNDFNDLDSIEGSYLVLDTKRKKFIRSGTAEVGLNNRWKEHISCSRLNTPKYRHSDFYSSYPHSNSNKDDIKKREKVKGQVSTLTQMIIVVFIRKHMHDLSNVLHWNSIEGQNLSKLSIHTSKDNIAICKYKRICYLAESAYSFSTVLEDIISSSPEC